MSLRKILGLLIDADTVDGVDEPTLSEQRTVASGSYTGNDGDDRQVTTGFKCSLVIVLAITTGSNNECGIFIPNRVTSVASGEVLYGGSALHATDGFTVYQTGDLLNHATDVYYYWAISE